MEKQALTLDELKPFLPEWFYELKKKIKEEKEEQAKDEKLGDDLFVQP